MNLKKTTFLAIIGLCNTFVVRIAGTFFPELFKDLTAAQVNGIFLLLVSLTAVLFFAYFLKYYIHEEQKELATAKGRDFCAHRSDYSGKRVDH